MVTALQNNTPASGEAGQAKLLADIQQMLGKPSVAEKLAAATGITAESLAPLLKTASAPAKTEATAKPAVPASEKPATTPAAPAAPKTEKPAEGNVTKKESTKDTILKLITNLLAQRLAKPAADKPDPAKAGTPANQLPQGLDFSRFFGPAEKPGFFSPIIQNFYGSGASAFCAPGQLSGPLGGLDGFGGGFVGPIGGVYGTVVGYNHGNGQGGPLGGVYASLKGTAGWGMGGFAGGGYYPGGMFSRLAM